MKKIKNKNLSLKVISELGSFEHELARLLLGTLQYMLHFPSPPSCVSILGLLRAGEQTCVWFANNDTSTVSTSGFRIVDNFIFSFIMWIYSSFYKKYVPL